MNNYFSNRCTVRQYSDRAISDAELKNMIEAATHAPNTGNMQWYSVIVTRDENKKRQLAPAHFNQPCLSQASVVLTFCLDLNRFEHWCRINAALPGFQNFQSFVAALIDTSLFAQQFVTIAEMQGLGTCYLGTTTYNAPQISEVLQLPQRVVPVTTVTVGYPVEGFESVPTMRLPVESIMHAETYRTPSDAEIATWYAPTEQASQRFVSGNGKETLAQVFTDVRYPKESAEYFSKIYKDFVNQNEFNI